MSQKKMNAWFSDFLPRNKSHWRHHSRTSVVSRARQRQRDGASRGIIIIRDSRDCACCYESELNFSTIGFVIENNSKYACPSRRKP